MTHRSDGVRGRRAATSSGARRLHRQAGCEARARPSPIAPRRVRRGRLAIGSHARSERAAAASFAHGFEAGSGARPPRRRDERTRSCRRRGAQSASRRLNPAASDSSTAVDGATRPGCMRNENTGLGLMMVGRRESNPRPTSVTRRNERSLRSRPLSRACPAASPPTVTRFHRATLA